VAVTDEAIDTPSTASGRLTVSSVEADYRLCDVRYQQSWRKAWKDWSAT